MRLSMPIFEKSADFLYNSDEFENSNEKTKLTLSINFAYIKSR